MSALQMLNIDYRFICSFDYLTQSFAIAFFWITRTSRVMTAGWYSEALFYRFTLAQRHHQIYNNPSSGVSLSIISTISLSSHGLSG
ncbi:MAG: hypothetical protein JKY46_03525 [Robiginitomaculum sp.]|nr:hypothetical protein [Robiginitomaculum sp.]